MRSEFILQLQGYVQGTLGLTLEFEEFDGARLPFYVRDRYSFQQAQLGSAEILFFGPGKLAPSPAPGLIQKDAIRLREQTGRTAIWTVDVMSSYQRTRLIELKVPFLVPGTQAYLPQLLIDLQETFPPAAARPEGASLPPSSQAILLHAIYHRDRNLNLHTAQIMGKYSSMSRSRALKDFEAAGLITTTIVGRTKQARLEGEWAAVWKRALPVLRSPIRKRLYLSDQEDATQRTWPLAGLSALAELTDLGEPERLVRAVSMRSDEGNAPPPVPVLSVPAEDARAEIQVWSYAPLADLGAPSLVDRLSLYLTLHDNPDDRVQGALKEMMAKIF